METSTALENRKAELVKDALNARNSKDSILASQQKELEETLVKLLTCRDALNLTKSLARDSDVDREENHPTTTASEGKTTTTTTTTNHGDVMLMCKQLKAIMTDLEKIDFHRLVMNDVETEKSKESHSNNVIVAENDRLAFDEGDILKRMQKKIKSESIGDKILKSELESDPDVVAVGEGLRKCVVGDETLVS